MARAPLRWRRAGRSAGVHRAARCAEPNAAGVRRGGVALAQWAMGGAGSAGDAIPSASTKVNVVT